MKNEKNRHLTKGVRDRCASARSLCAKVELHSADVTAALERCFAPFLGGCDLAAGVRRLTLFVINAIRRRIARLLDAERAVHELEVQGSQERERKNLAVEALHQMLASFRTARLWDRGPVVPQGTISKRPAQLLIEAARVRPHLDSPRLRVSPKPLWGFKPGPGLGVAFDAATKELDTALTEYERSRICCAEAREDRDLAMEELHRYVKAVRGLLRAVCALPGDA
jgi:hypothetical protein